MVVCATAAAAAIDTAVATFLTFVAIVAIAPVVIASIDNIAIALTVGGACFLAFLRRHVQEQVAHAWIGEKASRFACQWQAFTV